MPRQNFAVYMLGQFRIDQGAEQFRLPLTPRLQSLLAYLLLHAAAPISRQQLAFHFWPDSGEAQARTNLRKALHRLHHTLPGLARHLDSDGAALVWRAGAMPWTDVSRFEQALRQAEMAPLDQQPNLLQAALELYKGRLLPDVFDEWVTPLRDRLQGQYHAALDHLAELQEAQRDYPRAIETVQRLLADDPLHEGGYTRLMRLQALGDDIAGALFTYHRAVDLLQEELGVPPAPALQALYQHLLKRQALPEAAPRPAVRLLPLVGRDDVWQQLMDIWHAARSGVFQLVVLSGEAGIGKTRIADELNSWAARQGIAVLPAACFLSEQQLPFAPVAGWLRAPHLQRPLARLAPAWRSEVARILPQLLADDPKLAPPGPMTEPWQQRRLFLALVEAVAAAGSPLLLILEDLHWADADTLAWLHFLMLDKASSPIMLLVTVRSDELTRDHRLQRWQGALPPVVNGHTLLLSPLDRPAATALAAHVLGHALDAPVAEALFQASEGNPFFIVELARAGLQLGAAEIPQKIRTVVGSRLNRLSAPTLDLLGLAAVIGRTFTLPLLAAASSRPAGELMPALDELWQRQLIRGYGADGYDFSHDIIRQVALARLSLPRRRWAHQQAAAALEQLFAARLDAVHGQIAAHLVEAGQKAEAAHHFFLAAENASRLYAHDESLRLLQRALAMLPAGDPQRVRVHGARGEAYLRKGQMPEATAAFLEAASAAAGSLEAARWHSRRVRALALPGSLSLARPAFDEALRLLAQVPAEEQDDAFLTVWIDLHLHFLRALYFNGQGVEMELMAAAVEATLESHGSAWQRSDFYAARQWARNRIKRLNLSTEEPLFGAASLEAALETDDEDFIAFHRFNFGLTLLWRSELSRAHDYMQRALTQADAAGNVQLQCMGLTYLSFIYRFWGDEVRLSHMVDRLLPLAGGVSDYNYTGVCLAQRAWLAWRKGDASRAAALAADALADWRKVPTPYPLQWAALLPLLAIALDQGDLSGAIAHAAALVEPPQLLLPDALHAALVSAAAATADPSAAIPYLQEATRLARELSYL